MPSETIYYPLPFLRSGCSYQLKNLLLHALPQRKNIILRGFESILFRGLNRVLPLELEYRGMKPKKRDSSFIGDWTTTYSGDW